MRGGRELLSNQLLDDGVLGMRMAWQVDWSRVADWGATAFAIITLGGRQQYLKGKHSQKFADLEEKVEDLKEQNDRHEARLNDGGQAFARIDENLKNLKEVVENGFQRIEKQSSETNSLVIHHLANEAKEGKK